MRWHSVVAYGAPGTAVPDGWRIAVTQFVIAVPSRRLSASAATEIARR